MYRATGIAALLWLGLASVALAATTTAPAHKPAAAKPAAAPDALSMSEDAPSPENNTVVLQGLNKVTGHISKLEGPLGTVLRFGTLEVIARRCWQSSPEERPENAALLAISELKPGEGPKQIFLGWMFSSSPGLSGLEHPVYDITLLSCESRKDPEQKEGN